MFTIHRMGAPRAPRSAGPPRGRSAAAVALAAALALPVALRAQDGVVAPPKPVGRSHGDEAPPAVPAKPEEKKAEAPPVTVKLETTAPVVVVAVTTKDFDEPKAGNIAEYAIYEGVEKCGWLADTRVATPYDKWIRKAHESLLPKKPEGEVKLELPAPQLRLEGTITIEYFPNIFMAERAKELIVQVHAYLAEVKATISDGGGKKLKDVTFEHYYGEGQAAGETPKSLMEKARSEVEVRCAYVLLHELQAAPGFAAKVPADRKADFQKSVELVSGRAKDRLDAPEMVKTQRERFRTQKAQLRKQQGN